MSEAEALSDWLEAMESCYGDGSTDCDMEQVYKMRSIYDKNKTAKTGEKIKCACCGKTILKKNYQTQFCSNKGRRNCKDSFWNRVGQTSLATLPSNTNKTSGDIIAAQNNAEGQKGE